MALSVIAKTVGLGVSLALIPGAALAVNVSANDGSGEQHRVTSYSNGAAVTGTLKSTSGKKVGYNGKVALNNCSDADTGRYSSNTTSTSGITAGGTITTFPGGCGVQGVKSRVCTVRTGLPDACGSDSSTY